MKCLSPKISMASLPGILFILLLILPAISIAQKSELVYTTIKSKSFKKAVFDVDEEKQIVIYLPPSYNTSTKNYPVVYYLPGYTSPLAELLDGEYEGFQLQHTLDSLIKSEAIVEMIVVLCDGNNFLGGGFYVNSPLTGNYEHFIVKEVVTFIDSSFRTIIKGSYRGIAGHSMGGFGAFNLAMKYPETFSICYCMSPGLFDTTGFHEAKLLNTIEKLQYLDSIFHQIGNVKNQKKANRKFKQHVSHLCTTSMETYFQMFTIAYGAAFCPDTNIQFPHIHLPTKITTTENLYDNTFDCWNSGFGKTDSKIQDNITNLLKLKGIAFDCGLNDGWITKGTKYTTDLLSNYGISFDKFWYNGGHSDQLHLRLNNHMFQYFSNYFE